MANFAYVVDGKIDSVYDLIPVNWNNISNFCVLDEDILKSYGWYKLVKVFPYYDSDTQKLDHPTQYFEDGIAYETMEVLDKVNQSQLVSEEERLRRQWEIVRTERDRRMAEMDWRYLRHARQVRLNIEISDDITILDKYMQDLAELPDKQSDPFAIDWPVYGE